MANQIGDVLNSISDPTQDPVVQTENQTILDFHSALETVAHETPLNFSIHGLTNLGETVGLGRIGGDNLITDSAQAPGDILNGACPTAETADIVTDTGHTISAAGGLVSAVGQDLSNPDLIHDLPNDGTGLLGGLSPSPVGGGDCDNQGGSGDQGSTSSNPGDHLITVTSGILAGSPVADIGVLTTPDSQAPLGVEVGNGQPIVQASLLPNGIDLLPNGGDGSSSSATGSDCGDQDMSGAGGSGDQGSTSSNSGDHLITLTSGIPGGAPVIDIGVLTNPDGQSPIDVAVGNGPNIASIDGLSNSNPLNLGGSGSSGSHLITADAGAAAGAPILDAGVLTTPDSQSPVGLAVGNGPNIADVSALSHSDLLSFPNMAGAGTDALAGLVPSAADLGNGIGGDCGCPAPATSDQPFIDAHTDGAAIVQVHDAANGLLGVNNHVIV